MVNCSAISILAASALERRIDGMTIQEIEQAIQQLPKSELAALVA
jgi:hypothetical protein